MIEPAVSNSTLFYHRAMDGTMSLSSTLTRSRTELPSNTNTLNTISRGAAGSSGGYTNQSYKGDRSDRREQRDGVADAHLDQYPSSGTLPIQRPIYQPVRLAVLSPYTEFNQIILYFQLPYLM